MEQWLHEMRMDAEFWQCLSDQAMKQCSELRHLNDQVSEKYNELLEELEYMNVDSSLRVDEAKLWEGHYKALYAENVELEKQLAISQQIIALSAENARMGDQTPAMGMTDRAEQNESLLNSVVGIHFQNLPSMPEHLE
jgi:predicted nuclease with TOPRIM domain